MTEKAASLKEQPASGPKDEYALVCYISGALGGFLDILRTELVPDCSARSHVTLLPPRPLHGKVNEAREQLRRALPKFPAFVVELGPVSMFDLTRVVYLELLRGTPELERIHGILNQEALYYSEPFEYHPHVTLAQGPSVVPEAESKSAVARARWVDFRLPRTFTVDRVMFVQNGGDQGWLDIEEFAVGA